MKMFRFELRKLWHQKKFIWLFVITILCICSIFFQNSSQQSKMSERALEKLTPLIEESDGIYGYLKTLERVDDIEDAQLKQLEYTNKMATAFFHWKSAIYYEKWNEIPTYEYDFLINLQEYENAGGIFGSLQGIDREQAIKKNAWLRAHNLPYEDEAYPLSPALVLIESAAVLLGVAGVLVLLLFFGNTIAEEKQHQTWLTLKTLPIAKWKRFAGKYFSLLFVQIAFLTMVVGIGLIIPLILGDLPFNLQYPQLVGLGDTVTVISTFSYLLRTIVLFICACTFAFSFILLLSTWVKNTFSVLMWSALILILGFVATSTYTSLQSPLNPFQLFRFSQLLSEAPQSTHLLYPIFAIFWSILFMFLAIRLPEKEMDLFQSSVNMKQFQNGEIQKQRHAVWNSSIFEWRKMRRQGILKQIYYILFLLVLLGYFAISQHAYEKEKVYLDSLISYSQFIENQLIPHGEKLIKDFEKVIEESDDEFEIDNFKSLITGWEEIVEFYHKQSTKSRAAFASYEKLDWISYYEYQLFENRISKGEFDTELFRGRSSELSHFTIDASIAEKKWLIERNIQPVFSGNILPTIYDNREENKPLFEDWNRKVDDSGLFLLYLFFGGYFYFVPIILFLFLVGAGFASERGKKSTFQLLKTQPIAEKNIFLGKVINAISTALLSSVGILGFIILIGTIFNRFGDWHYPILHYNSKSLVESPIYTGMRSFEGGFHFISLGNYLVSTIVLFLFVLLFLIVLSIFLSTFIKNQLSVFSTVILVGVVGYVVSNVMLTESTHLSPFIYFNILKITNGEISTLINNPSINALTGSFVLLVYTLILLVIGYLLLHRKNKTRE